ncbi:MAG: diadenylate cyclase CdaA [Polyangiaceae bacterium]|nr:diadenylate cyclase CdaA [Polyangiaceae bacterium]
MLEGLLHLFSPRPWGQVVRDLIDLVIVAYVIYRALLVLRGTRAMQMGLGLAIVGMVYLGAKVFGLVTLLNLLSGLLSSIILIIVVVFQNDIRRALIRVGGKAWFTGGREQQSRVIDEVVAAATELARHRMGAIIAFEQDANLLEFVKSEGIPIDAAVTRELLVSMFVPESVNKLHDGAVLIRDLKIARAGVFFPMPETKILDAALGSRHRAALGITEETDAVVVVVSEERGTISFCFSGNIVSNLDGQSLRQALSGLFGRAASRKKAPPSTGAKKLAASSVGPVSIPPVPASPAVPSARPNTIPPPPAPGRTPVPVGPIQVREREWDREPAPISVRTGSKLLTSTPMRPAEPRALTEPRPAGDTSSEKTEKPADAAHTTPVAKATTFVPSSPSVPPPPISIPPPASPAASSSPAAPPSGDES